MSQQKKRDPYHRIKYMAFCMSQLPPEGVPSDMTDFVTYAKFQLSVDKHLLMQDPVWGKYTDEEILVEYYANLFSRSKERVAEFEASLDGTSTAQTLEDFNAWADRMIEKNQQDLEEKAKDLEDSVSFTPQTLGG